MRNNLYEPATIQGKITSIATPANDTFDYRKYNSTQSKNKGRLYSGGSDPLNHWIIPGELVYGCYNNETDGKELVFSSISGMEKSTLARDDLYFAGVAEGGSKYTEENQGDAIGLLKAGKTSIVNNGPEDISAGDLCVFEVLEGDNPWRQDDMPQQKNKPVVVPLRTVMKKTNSKRITAVLNEYSIDSNNNNGGYGYKKLFTEDGELDDDEEDGPALTESHKEIIELKYSLLMFLYKALKSDNLKKIGAGGAAIPTPDGLLNAIKNDSLFLNGVVADMIFEKKSKSRDGMMEFNALRMFDASRNDAFMKQRMRIIGKAAGCAEAHGGQLDIMIGYNIF